MAQISEKIMTEIKKTARDYMSAVKGHDLTDNDVMIAENLIVFGYLKAMDEQEQLEESLKKLENRYDY